LRKIAVWLEFVAIMFNYEIVSDACELTENLNDRQAAKAISQILNSYPFKINKVILTKQEYIEELKNLPSWWKDDFYRKDVLQIAWY